jgi:hypothetical protein
MDLKVHIQTVNSKKKLYLKIEKLTDAVLQINTAAVNPASSKLFAGNVASVSAQTHYTIDYFLSSGFSCTMDVTTTVASSGKVKITFLRSTNEALTGQ